MKIPSLQLFSTVCIAVLACSPLLANDHFHLKDGRVLEGTILEDRGDSYLLEVQVTRSIKDEMVISKGDIDRIERQSLDAPAFEPIRALSPIPDLLTAADYSARITMIEEFIKTFPESEFLDQAKEILAAHQAEQVQIDEGGIKFNGEIHTPAQRLANAYEIDSRMAQAAIQRAIQDGSLLSALRLFHEFEKKFTGSAAWRELLPLMRQVAASHQNTARRMSEEYDTLIEQQNVGLGRLSRDDRNNAIRAIEERDANLKSRYDQERSNHGTWLSINPYFRPALEDTVRFADQEIRRLEAAAVQPPAETSPSELWRNAIAAIQSGDATAIRNAISAARSARISDTHLSKLEELAANAE